MSTREYDLLFAAYHALRSYQFGNDSTDLAKEIADEIDVYLKTESRKNHELVRPI